MASQKALSAFTQLFELLLSDEALPLTKEARSFLLLGSGEFCREPETSLDVIFGLRNERGGVSIERADAMRRRDRLLVLLWRQSPQWASLTPYAAAKAMWQDGNRYESIRWKREETAVTPPAEEPASTWWRILKMGQPLPGPKQLRNILSWEIQ